MFQSIKCKRSASPCPGFPVRLLSRDNRVLLFAKPYVARDCSIESINHAFIRASSPNLLFFFNHLKYLLYCPDVDLDQFGTCPMFRGPPGPSSRPLRLGASGRQRQKGRIYDDASLAFSKISAACYTTKCQIAIKSVQVMDTTHIPKDRQELCSMAAATGADKNRPFSICRDIVNLGLSEGGQ